MAKIETIEDFYRKKKKPLPENLNGSIGHFNVFRMEDFAVTRQNTVQYNRRNYYKIALLRGDHVYHYASKSIEAQGVTLMFFNPRVPYTCEQFSELSSGYFCIFTEAFITQHFRTDVREYSMFLPGNKPSYSLDSGQDSCFSGIFEKMLAEIDSDYTHKYDLIRHYVMEIIHNALKMHPTEKLYQNVDASSRLTAVFSELLERQFPIDSVSQRFTMRSARDYADQLSVHVNHLNRAIRQTTGKTTTTHIFERLTSEAMALLRHTDWNIAEISYSLGFEEPAHFNQFFKKQTGEKPSAFRTQAVFNA